MRRPGNKHAAASLLAATLAACGLQYSIGPGPEPCESDEDCMSGQRCVQMACIDSNGTGGSALSVELTPPPSLMTAGTTQIRHVDIGEAGAAVDWTLAEAAVFEQVLVLDPNTDAPVPASVTIIGADRIPGRTVDTRLTITPDSPAPLRLLPGIYTARVLPLDERRPGIEVKDWEIVKAKTTPVKEFRLGTGQRRLYGTVSARTMLTERIGDVTVRAVSVPAGLASTVVVTDETGAYDIELPETEDTAFRLIAQPSAAAQPAWGYEQIVNVPRQTARQIDIGLDRTSGDVVGEVRLQVLGTDDDGGNPMPVVGASITCTATTSLPTRRYSAEGKTDPEGVLVSTDGPWRLLAARYRVDVEPPPTSPYARTSTLVDFTQIGPGMVLDRQLALRPRVLVHGHITSPLGLALGSASVLFDALDVETRPLQLSTDDQGRFDAYLDPGRYLVRIEGGLTERGTAESHPVTYTLLEVGQGEPEMELEYSVPSGRVVQGTIRGHGGEAIAKAGVELFLEIEDRAVSLGSTLSDESGEYTLLISGIELPD